MKNLIVWILIGLGCLSMNEIKAELVCYADTLEDAVSLSESTSKNILVVFGAEWCQYCEKLKKELVDDVDVKNSLDNYIVCMVDIDNRSDLKKEYKVKSIPDSRILKDRKEIDMLVGYPSKTKYIAWIKNAR